MAPSRAVKPKSKPPAKPKSRPPVKPKPSIRRGPTPLQLARLLRAAARDKKAWDPVILDVRDKTSVADYFVICEGETDRQVRAIADGMSEALKSKGVRALAVDGYDHATWILLDFDSVLAHIFLPGERTYYDLESLWSPAAKRRNQSL